MRRLQLREHLWIAAIVVIAAGIASWWAIRVPFFQEPDEVAHADYVFSLYDAGRPFVVTDGKPASEVAPQTRYLMAAADYRRMRYSVVARAPAGYDTPAFFSNVDRGAPAPSGRVPQPGAPVPYVMFGYPYTYYAIALAALTWSERMLHSLTAGFFAMRGLGVLCLAATLVLAYRTMRNAGLAPATSAGATLAIGIFPLASAVMSAVQPDVLVVAFSSLAILCCSATSRRNGTVVTAAQTIALCGLAATKQHYAIAVYAVVLAHAAATSPARVDGRAIARFAALALLPIATSAYVYSSMGPVRGVESVFHFASRASGGAAHARDPAGVAVGTFVSMIRGNVAQTFWTRFGFRSGHVFPEFADGIFAFVDVVAFALLCATIFALLRRIVRVGRDRSATAAVRLVARGYALNASLAITLVLVAAAVASGGELELQGRYWLPALVPLAVVAIRTMPRALAPAHRAIVSKSVALAFAAYAVFASVAAAYAMNAYYYGGKAISVYVPAASIETPATLDLAAPAPAAIEGSAIDMDTGLPARRVYAIVDGRRTIEGVTRLPSPHLAAVFNDPLVAAAAFRIVLPASALPPGDHVARVYAGGPGVPGTRVRGEVAIHVGRSDSKRR